MKHIVSKYISASCLTVLALIFYFASREFHPTTIPAFILTMLTLSASMISGYLVTIAVQLKQRELEGVESNE